MDCRGHGNDTAYFVDRRTEKKGTAWFAGPDCSRRSLLYGGLKSKTQLQINSFLVLCLSVCLSVCPND